MQHGENHGIALLYKESGYEEKQVSGWGIQVIFN